MKKKSKTDHKNRIIFIQTLSLELCNFINELRAKILLYIPENIPQSTKV